MQQIVYEIVHRGGGDLGDKGHGHLYAIALFLPGLTESIVSRLEESPLLGEKPTRIIKTHLPAKLCPYSEQAKYIYVTRHPVSYFASILDYNRTLLGSFIPDVDKMPEHVAAWWRWAQSRENVLFLHYEQITRDFGAILLIEWLASSGIS